MSEGTTDLARTPGAPALGIDLKPSPTAAEMTDALRSGVAARRRQEQMTPGADAARLTALGNIEGLGAVAKPGAAAPLVRFMRRALEVFLRPWLAMQTIFNAEISRRFDESATSVRDLRRRVPLLEEGLQQLESRLRALEHPSHDALAGRDLLDPAIDRTAPSTNGYVERLFIHSRLPPPPATVAIGRGVELALEQELTSLGYLLSRDGQSRVDACVAVMDAADVAGAEMLDALFDAARATADAARVVLIVRASAESADGAGQRIAEQAITRGWRVIESLLCDDVARAAGRSMPGTSVIGITLARSRTDAPAG